MVRSQRERRGAAGAPEALLAAAHVRRRVPAGLLRGGSGGPGHVTEQSAALVRGAGGGLGEGVGRGRRLAETEAEALRADALRLDALADAVRGDGLAGAVLVNAAAGVDADADAVANAVRSERDHALREDDALADALCAGAGSWPEHRHEPRGGLAERSAVLRTARLKAGHGGGFAVGGGQSAVLAGA